MVRVYLEITPKRTFACALDWPGWCRSGKTEAAALEAIAQYLSRYGAVAADAGFPLPPGTAEFEVLERVDGNATTAFGAPAMPAAADAAPLSPAAASRLATLVAAGWHALDRAAGRAPQELAKGPRGGGRDRDAVLQHVLAAEAAYARKLGVRQKEPRFDDVPGVRSLRDGIIEAIRKAEPAADAKWPLPYGARRIAWHAIDHAWEIEDRGGLEPERVG